MAEKFNFDFFQTPHVGVEDTEIVRTDVKVAIRRPADMKMSNFGACKVGARMGQGTDYTRINLGFKDKGESEDINVITEDTGIGQNVKLNNITVGHNPYVAGSSVKLTRDDQAFKMTMSNDAEGAQVNPPKFDVMDTKVSLADGFDDVTTVSGMSLNWPSEGWRSFGGKYDFLPYVG